MGSGVPGTGMALRLALVLVLFSPTQTTRPRPPTTMAAGLAVEGPGKRSLDMPEISMSPLASAIVSMSVPYRLFIT